MPFLRNGLALPVEVYRFPRKPRIAPKRTSAVGRLLPLLASLAGPVAVARGLGVAAPLATFILRVIPKQPVSS